MIKPLSENERVEAAERLKLWIYDPGRRALHRSLTFESFSETIGAMMRIALVADRQDHHPEWCNVYNRLDIWLTTHDAGDISERDLRLANEIDAIAATARTC